MGLIFIIAKDTRPMTIKLTMVNLVVANTIMASNKDQSPIQIEGENAILRYKICYKLNSLLQLFGLRLLSFHCIIIISNRFRTLQLKPHQRSSIFLCFLMIRGLPKPVQWKGLEMRTCVIFYPLVTTT